MQKIAVMRFAVGLYDQGAFQNKDVVFPVLEFSL